MRDTLPGTEYDAGGESWQPAGPARGVVFAVLCYVLAFLFGALLMTLGPLVGWALERVP